MSADPSATNLARVYRAILAALDDSAAGRDAFNHVLTELGDCPRCRRDVMAQLAGFAADRINRSPTPQRWERWLEGRITELLDQAAQ